jgi:endonuclease/exonuclease/phosphatase family metal-dependent hydrolase
MARTHERFARTASILVTILTMTAGASAQMTVSPRGSFDPVGGMYPYPTIYAAAQKAADQRLAGVGDGTLTLQAGTYPETMTLDTRLVFMSQGGVATIGDMGQAQTTFDVITLNTHLYGAGISEAIIDILLTFDAVDAPLHWQESERPVRMGNSLAAYDADLVAVQEVWHSSSFDALYAGCAHVYPNRFYGGFIDGNGVPPCIPIPGVGCWSPLLPSGLGVLSNHPMVCQQFVFDAESGADDFFEPFATKGWVFAEVQKDGFTIGVYNTHAIAGDANVADNWQVRRAQLQQLATAIEQYRAVKPSNPVILVGDFNVVASSSSASEYKSTLQNLFGNSSLQMVDAARADYQNLALNAVTSDANNKLGVYFDPSGYASARLDYVLYSPESFNKSTRLVLDEVQTVKHRGPTGLSEDGLTTSELTDHWGVHASFTVVRH